MEIAMNADRGRHYAVSAIAFVFAALVTIGLLGAVTSALQSRGRPLQRLAAAERACVDHAYISERELCMCQWLAARDLLVAHR